jgi:hypothetical protein
MDDQEKQDDFDEIVVEDAASEPGGCLGLVAVAALTVLMVAGCTFAGSSITRSPLASATYATTG